MKIVIAMDSFKESMSAKEACLAIEAGMKGVLEHASYYNVPMADGGEGTVQSLVDATNGKLITTTVSDPLNNQISAFYGILGDNNTAIIEMAAASGLELLPTNKRNPLLTTTKGTGELIAHAIEQGVTKIIMGIGGSATNDAGIGMAQALGYRFLDKDGNELKDGGGQLNNLATIDTSLVNPKLKDITFEVACDVDNPLTGKNGAAYVYGKQKGGNEESIKLLDNNLKHFNTIVKEQFSMDINDISGAGAAGGLGAGSIVFLNANLRRGFDIVTQIVNLENIIKDADLVITGEGRIDYQTMFGKTPIGVAKIAKQYDIDVIALCGSKSDDYHNVYEHGIDCVFSIIPYVTTIEATLQTGKANLTDTAINIAKLIKLKVGN